LTPSWTHIHLGLAHSWTKKYQVWNLDRPICIWARSIAEPKKIRCGTSPDPHVPRDIELESKLGPCSLALMLYLV
jgi:hypothetical protein